MKNVFFLFSERLHKLNSYAQYFKENILQHLRCFTNNIRSQEHVWIFLLKKVSGEGGMPFFGRNFFVKIYIFVPTVCTSILVRQKFPKLVFDIICTTKKKYWTNILPTHDPKQKIKHKHEKKRSKKRAPPPKMPLITLFSWYEQQIFGF